MIADGIHSALRHVALALLPRGRTSETRASGPTATSLGQAAGTIASCTHDMHSAGMNLKTLLLFMVICGAPALVQARCVVAADLETGISFRREDGRAGLARRQGALVHVTYAVSTDAWRDDRLAVFGIYETRADVHFDALPSVGGGHPRYDWVFAGKTPVPQPGQSWTTRVRETRREDIGTAVAPPPQRKRFAVTYAFLPAQDVTLSRCSYTVIPVEAAIGEGAGTNSQRWLYFPDLGFGLETRRPAHLPGKADRRGLLAMTPVAK